MILTMIPVEVPIPALKAIKEWLDMHGWKPTQHMVGDGTVWDHVGGSRFALTEGKEMGPEACGALLVELANIHDMPPAVIWSQMTGGTIDVDLSNVEHPTGPGRIDPPVTN